MSNQTYQVFTRTSWKHNPKWPNGREPHMGRKKVLGYAETLKEARKMCKEWNDNNPPGPLGRRAEFTSDY